MDQLKKAMELTRRAQQAGREQKGPRTVVPFVCDTGAPIPYSQTRVVRTRRRLLARKRIVLDDGDENARHAYKVLRTQVLQRMARNGWNSLAVTSPGQGQGKTVTAINLAINVAREVRYTALLADLDLRRPRIHRHFGYVPTYGVADHLRDGIPLSDVLFNPQIDGLVILPGRDRVENSSELLSSPSMFRMVAELASRYPSRMLLFDLPPLLSRADVLAFAPAVDAILLVVEEGKTYREELERSRELLTGSNLLGTVLNKAPESAYHL